MTWILFVFQPLEMQVKEVKKRKEKSLNISEHGMIKGYVQLQLEGKKKKRERERGKLEWSLVKTT